MIVPMRRLPLFVFAALAMLTACAQQSTAATAQAQPGVVAADRIYAEAMVRTMRSDLGLARLMARYHVAQTVGVGLVVQPNGFVQKGFVHKGALPVEAEVALIHHLANTNFGPFPPGMPQEPQIMTVPVPVPSAAEIAQARQAASVPAFRRINIVLFQPNAVLTARVGSAQPLARYMWQLDKSLEVMFAAMPPGQPLAGSLVMGVKPGLQSRAWVVAPAGTLAPAETARIRQVAEAVPPVAVHGGPIAFAFDFSLWNGTPAPGTPSTPMPQAWQRAAKGGTLVPDGIFARIWP